MLAELRQVLPLRLQIATAFLFVMWLFFQAYVPWQAIDDDLLQGSGQFNSVTDLAGWQRELGNVQWTDDTGFIRLTPASRFRYQLPLNSGELWLVSGRMQTQGIEFRRNKWDAARIMIYFENARGEIIWTHPHNVGYAFGDTDWITYRELISVPFWAKRAWLELAHYGRGGQVNLDDISVKPAIWKPSYKHWQMAFGMSWAAIAMWLVLNSHFWTRRWGRLLLFNGLLIVVGVTLPPATMFQVANSGANFTKKLFVEDNAQVANEARQSQKPPVAAAKSNVEQRQKPPAVVQSPAQEQVLPLTDTSMLKVNAANVQKSGHALLFACMAFLAVMAFAGDGRNGLLVYTLLLFAISTEVLQLVIIGRTFSLTDLSMDLLGMAIGMLLAFAWRVYRAASATA